MTVDFSREDAFEKPQEAGYHPSKKTIFLWEGVTLYLDEEDVRRTLRDVRGNAPRGSVIVADIHGERMIRLGARSINKKALDYPDEGMSFGLAFDTDFEQELERFASGEGVTVGETFFIGSSSEKGPFMVVAELSV